MGDDVVVWEADGSPGGGVGYGHAIADRLVAAGLTVSVVPLPERDPTEAELAAPAHVVSGGATAANSNTRWVRATRDRLTHVLDRARAGDASVAGICWGAQLIATVLAGRDAVRPSEHGPELGLVRVHDAAGVRETAAELHFQSIEPEAVRAAGGDIVRRNWHTEVQAFTVGSAITGTQFHSELDPVTIAAAVYAHPRLLASSARPASSVYRSIRRLRHSWSDELFHQFVRAPSVRAVRSLEMSSIEGDEVLIAEEFDLTVVTGHDGTARAATRAR